jgi:hypothetical protein
MMLGADRLLPEFTIRNDSTAKVPADASAYFSTV